MEGEFSLSVGSTGLQMGKFCGVVRQEPRRMYSWGEFSLFEEPEEEMVEQMDPEVGECGSGRGKVANWTMIELC